MNSMFSSFIMAGFECNAALDHRGGRFDDLKTTKHHIHCASDYDLLKDIGITTVREGLLWSQIDKGNGVYDFSLFEKLMQQAKRKNIQQIWDLNHFDFPEYIDVFSKSFIPAFTNYAIESLKIIRNYQKGTVFITPINEISFFSFMGGAAGAWAPFKTDKGVEMKEQLVKATISAINAIRKLDSDVRFIIVDPLMVRKPFNPNNIIGKSESYTFEKITFETFDILYGNLNPEFGGSPKHLDIIGINHYPTSEEWLFYNQDFHITSTKRIEWRDEAWEPLSKVLASVSSKYNKPLVVSETGAWGHLRSDWWNYIIEQIGISLELKLDLHGVCAYPVIDRYDWSGGHLTNSGLWDFKKDDKSCKRIPFQPAIDILRGFIKKGINNGK